MVLNIRRDEIESYCVCCTLLGDSLIGIASETSSSSSAPWLQYASRGNQCPPAHRSGKNTVANVDGPLSNVTAGPAPSNSVAERCSPAKVEDGGRDRIAREEREREREPHGGEKGHPTRHIAARREVQQQE